MFNMINQNTKLALGVVLACVCGVAAYNCANIVDEGEKAVVLTFGEISTTWEPGLHFKLPFIQSREDYSLRIKKATFGRFGGADQSDASILTAYSNDQQIIESYALSMTWCYDGGRIGDVYKYFGADDGGTVFTNVVTPTVVQVTKAVLGQYTAQTIVQERAKLDTTIEQSLKDQLKDLPIKILSVQFEDVSFSEKYEDVLEQTAQKKMEIEKAQNELQRIQIESQQQVAQAEARNKAIKLQADAEAYQIEARAKAEAEAIRLRGDALRENPRLVELTIAEKWNGTVPQTVVQGTSGNSIVPLMNISK